LVSYVAPYVSALDVEGTGAITKANAISALQSSGEGSYDQVREVLKGVSVDASGKVELEDWVEVSIVLL
jgi:plastin-1